MIIRVLKEIKNNENRVALTPQGTKKLVGAGHTVLIERDAGIGFGFSDEEYISARAEIVNTPPEICKRAHMIVKVKEPLP